MTRAITVMLLCALAACDKTAQPAQVDIAKPQPAQPMYTSEDCIIEGMKGVSNDLAARAVASACYTKYNSQSSTVELLPPDALQQVTGEAQPYVGTVAGIIKNGTDAWTLTEITLRVRDTTASRFRDVTFAIKVPPRAAEGFNERLSGMDILAGLDIISARGWKKSAKPK